MEIHNGGVISRFGTPWDPFYAKFTPLLGCSKMQLDVEELLAFISTPLCVYCVSGEERMLEEAQFSNRKGGGGGDPCTVGLF